MEYTVEYFIAKFEAIPEERWFIGAYDSGLGEKCALGHCGYRTDKNGREQCTAEGLFLGRIFQRVTTSPVSVNDDVRQLRFIGNTPKQRILNLLRAIKYEKDEMAYVDKEPSPLPALAEV